MLSRSEIRRLSAATRTFEDGLSSRKRIGCIPMPSMLSSTIKCRPLGADAARGNW
jgi:hypothetical protein